jgi:anaerobic magnesium-protoporphyrin IX monomethyl ester cyclase
MAAVTLIYPYLHPSNDRSLFRYPPLGLGYIAARLKENGITVDIVDCTFLDEGEALKRVRRSSPEIIGIQSMFSVKRKALEFARLLRGDCKLLIGGGPLPTSNPSEFLQDFDVVVMGEGEETMLELVCCFEKGSDLSNIRGIAYKENGHVRITPRREFIKDIDGIPFPARELFANSAYKDYHMRRFGYTITPVMTSRGCPYNCDFCSRPVFGETYRARSPRNVVDEIEEVISLGYDRIWFADDCFTLGRSRLMEICDEMIRRRLRIGWECLSRVDSVDGEVMEKMKRAGCMRVFFGIESGNDSILALMKKKATIEQARKAVCLAKLSAIEVGAFFIVGYPGETDETILDTVRFASSLPLDYLSFTLPYPIPGTPLYERVKDRMLDVEWESPYHPGLIEHELLYRSTFSEAKLKMAIVKGYWQHYLRRYLGPHGYMLMGKPTEYITDHLFKILP